MCVCVCVSVCVCVCVCVRVCRVERGTGREGGGGELTLRVCLFVVLFVCS